MTEKMQKLWVYSELFYPEETSTSYIMTKICNKLVSKYEVEVIAGEISYDKNNNSDFLILDKNIRIHRIKSFKGNKDKIVTRILKLVSLSFGFFFHLLFKVKSGDKVLTVTNPATFLVFASITKIFKNIEIIILVHDVFPENTIAAGFIKSKKDLKYKIFKRIFDKSYASFDHIIVLGRDMKLIFEDKVRKYKIQPKIDIIENWAEINRICPGNKFEFYSGKIVFQYAGNMGSIQGLDALIKIIEKVENPDIIFEFIGDGRMKQFLEKYVTEKSIRNVLFKQPFSRIDQNLILNSCTIALVTLADEMFGLGVPSKTYNILAAGKPILYIGAKNSEVYLLIDEFNIGYHFESDEYEELLNFFNEITINKERENIIIKGRNARELAEDYYSEDIILNKFLKII